MNVWLIVAVGLVLGVIVGWWLGSIRGMPVLGAILGLTGIIGWAIVLVLPKRGPVPLPASPILPPDSPTEHRPPDLPAERLPQHPPDVHVMREHEGDQPPPTTT